MSLCTIGLESKLKRTQVAITVSTSHLFIRLANALDWKSLYDIVAADLKSTTKKGFWNLGRRLYIRVHLAVYILQCLLKTTDREIEARINDTPVLQVFCGQSVITRWKCPDHTKVEEFRNRLSPETQQKVGIFVIKVAQSLGMADPTWMDVDSTVQEANITYPNDATLMKKLSEKVHKVIEFFTRKKNAYLPDGVIPEIEKIRKKSKEYFFLKKKCKNRGSKEPVCELSQIGDQSAIPSAGVFEYAESASNQLTSLEYSIPFAADSRVRDWLFKGCASLCKNKYHQGRKNLIIPCSGCCLHSEGKSRQAKGVWKSFSTRKNWRKFSHRIQLLISQNGGQTFTDAHYSGTSRDLWHRRFKGSRDRQRLLHIWQYSRCQRSIDQQQWNSTPSECQNSASSKGSASAQGPPGWNRALDRSRQVLWIEKKQNEIGWSHVGFGVQIRHGVQFTPNFKTYGGSMTAKEGKNFKSMMLNWKWKIKKNEIT